MNSKPKVIAVLEDEELIRSMIQINLEGEGFQVLAFENGEDLLAHKEVPYFDVFILDLMLPGISGQGVTIQLRERGVHRPILMVTAKAELEDCVSNLDKGVDDYLVKPFDMKELIARVHVLLRRDSNWKCPVLDMEV